MLLFRNVLSLTIHSFVLSAQLFSIAYVVGEYVAVGRRSFGCGTAEPFSSFIVGRMLGLMFRLHA